MLIYFLGGESEFSDKLDAYGLLQKSDFRCFKKIGTFAKALKTQRPELIFADKNFFGANFDLRNFLSEQRIEAPLVFFNEQKANNSAQNSIFTENFLYTFKERNKIPDKLFELLRLLYTSTKSQSLSEIRSRLFEAGINWSENCARVALCRLRKILKAQKDHKIDLIKEYKGYKLLLSNQLV